MFLVSIVSRLSKKHDYIFTQDEVKETASEVSDVSTLYIDNQLDNHSVTDGNQSVIDASPYNSTTQTLSNTQPSPHCNEYEYCYQTHKNVSSVNTSAIGNDSYISPRRQELSPQDKVSLSFVNQEEIVERIQLF